MPGALVVATTAETPELPSSSLLADRQEEEAGIGGGGNSGFFGLRTTGLTSDQSTATLIERLVACCITRPSSVACREEDPMRTTVVQFGAGMGIIAALASIPSASAITNGQVDGNLHPNVCAVVVVQQDGTNVEACTCTLIARRAVLTDAHCGELIGNPGPTTPVFVTFDNVVDVGSTLLEGRFIPHPDFRKRQNDPNNIAVISLLADVEADIDVADLPPVGLLDDLNDDHALKGATFTAVGYGATGRQVPPGPPTFVGAGTRRFATMGFLSLTKARLQLTQVPARGFGGTCVGDTGAPNFLGGATSNLVVAITYAGDFSCAATNTGYRLDTENARDFLESFLD